MNQKDSKFISISSFVTMFVIVCICLLIIIGEFVLPHEYTYHEVHLDDYTVQWYRLLENGSKAPVSLPHQFDIEPGEVLYLTSTIPIDVDKDYSIIFRNNHMFVKAYIDGELIHEFSNESTRLWGSDSPSCFIALPLDASYSGKELTLSFYTDTRYAGMISEFYYEINSEFWLYLIHENLLEFLIGCILMSCGILCMMYGLIILFKRKIFTSVGYIGLASFVMSCWVISNSNFRQIIFPNMSLASDIPFLMVILIPIVFSFFINNLQKNRYITWYKIIIILSGVDFIVCSALNMMGMIPLVTSFKTSVVLIGAFALTAATTMITDAIKKRIKPYLIPAIGILVGLFCGLIQMVFYIMKVFNFNGLLLTFGLLLVILSTVIDAIRDYNQKIAERNSAVEETLAKDQFLANMSHEIRTPINAILGMNEMILREGNDPSILEYANDIQSASQTLLSLINDILDYSKMSNKKMTLVEVDYQISSLINDTYNMIIERAKKKSLDFILNIDPNLPAILHGDDVRIRQIIVNFLTNSVKYTEAGSITLNLSAADIDGKFNLKISVADTGIGIKEVDIDKLFSSFQRVDEKKNRNIEGTGLGLPIVKQLVELMNGTIDVQSTYCVGSTFTCTIPQLVISDEKIGNFSIHQEKTISKVKHEKIIAPKAHILVVDDLPMNLKVFRGLLKETQITIDTAESGMNCLALIKDTHFDMIFLDHMMPQMDGIETFRKMKSLPENKNRTTPVIMLTANAVAGAKEDYLSEGFTDYLSKPIKSDELIEMLYAHLPPDLIENTEDDK